jgi:rhodanese-related sulfurtransferase
MRGAVTVEFIAMLKNVKKLKRGWMKNKNILKKTQILGDELVELLNARKKKLIDFELIDIREPFEYKNARIKGVDRLLPVTNFQNDMKIWNDLIKNKKDFIIYCRSGNRTSYLQNFLKQKFNIGVPHLAQGIIDYPGIIEEDK